MALNDTNYLEFLFQRPLTSYVIKPLIEYSIKQTAFVYRSEAWRKNSIHSRPNEPYINAIIRMANTSRLFNLNKRRAVDFYKLTTDTLITFSYEPVSEMVAESISYKSLNCANASKSSSEVVYCVSCIQLDSFPIAPYTTPCTTTYTMKN